MYTGTWNQATLNDVVRTWIVGSTPPRTEPERFTREGGIPWAKAEDVNGGRLFQTSEQLISDGGGYNQLIGPGAVLLTTAGTIGKTAIAGRPMFCNQAVQALSFNPDLVLPEYGYYFLQFRRPLLEHLASATTIPYVSKRKLQDLAIYFPSIPAQREIVAHLKTADALRQKASTLQKPLKSLLRSLTIRETQRCRNFLPLEKMLSGPPRPGLRTRTPPEGVKALLISRLGASGGLAPFSEYSYTGISPQQFEIFGLRPRDILIRSTASASAVRAALVEELPERALVGGNLIRLRLHPRYSPIWLLAWLLGPDGDQLFVQEKLRKESLLRLRVPVISDPQGFERIFGLYTALTQKAAQFSSRADALFQTALVLLFSPGLDEEGPSLTDAAGGRLAEDRLTRLTEPMQAFLLQMSHFQQQLYYALLKTELEQPVHRLLSQMPAGPRKKPWPDGFQDAQYTIALLEQFGLVERDVPQKIPVPSHDTNGPGAKDQYLEDHNGLPICIDVYKPTREIFEEKTHAAGTGEDTNL